jgi:hypothetical protein
MTEQDQERVWLAELHGWEWKGDPGWECWWSPHSGYRGCPLFSEPWRNKYDHVHVLPAYHSDLTAVHNLEMCCITDEDVPDWVAHLVDIVVPALGWDGTGRIRAAEACLRADAEQRVAALLKLRNYKPPA